MNIERTTLMRIAALAVTVVSANTLRATDYYWNGGTGDNNTQKTLDVADNWCTDSELTTPATTAPGSGDTAHFTANSWAKLAGGKTFAADIEIADHITVGIQTQSDNNPGTLSGAIAVGASSTLTLRSHVSSSKTTTLKVTGAITGSGKITCDSSNSYISFSGAKFTNFSGGFTASENTSGIDYSTLPTDLSAGAWDLSAITSTYKLLRKNATCFKFGALKGYIETAEDGNSGAKYGKRSAVEIGALNEDSSIWGTWYVNGTNKNYTNAVFWVATSATLTLAVTNTYGLYISGGGTVDVPDTFVLRTEWASGFSSYGIYLTGNGGYLTLDGDSVHDNALAGKIKSVGSDAVVGFINDTAASVALPSTVSGKKFAKKGAGALTVTGVTSFGATTVSEGTLTIPAGSTLTSLSAADSALIVDVTSASAGTVLTISDGFTGKIAFTGKDSKLYSLTTTDHITFTLSRPAATFVWTDAAASDSNWETAGNWTVNDAAVTETPTSADTVTFNEGASVTLSASVTVASIVFNGATTLSGAQITTTGISGTGAITLGNSAGLVFNNSADAEYANNFTITAEAATPAVIKANNKYVTLSGSFTGTSTAAVKFDAIDWTGVLLGGSFADYYGTATVANTTGYTRNRTKLTSTSAASINTTWVVYNCSGNSSANDNFINESGDFYFGSLSGAVYNKYNKSTGTSVRIGASNSSGLMYDGSKDAIYKQDSGTLTLNSGTSIYGFQINENGGKVVIRESISVYNWVNLKGGTLEMPLATDTAPVSVTAGNFKSQSGSTINLVGTPAAGTTYKIISTTTGITEKYGTVTLNGNAPPSAYTVAVSDKTLTLTTPAGVVADGVIVTDTWLTTYGLSSATAETLAASRSEGNGYSFLACYALGLDPMDKTDKPIVTLVSNSDGTLKAMLVHPNGTEISAADTVTLTTTYTRYTSPNAVSGTELASPNAISVANAVDSTTGVGYIKATVSISAK